LSATLAVREELAHVGGAEGEAHAELAGLLRFGGALTLSERGLGFVLDTSVGAVARRAKAAAEALRGDAAVHCAVELHRPAGLRPSRYRVVLSGTVAPFLTRLGLLDGAGRPVEGLPTVAATAPAGFVRGALMAAGSVSRPGAPAHLEVRAPGERAAEELAALLARADAPGARAARHGEGWRVVVKSGEQVASVLARAGAHGAFLRLDGARLRRQLRGEANRAANADRANLARAVGASARQLAAISRALGAEGWADLPEEVREVALARLANPEASLAELGALLDPPVGKATVHRRLARLLAVADEGE
jgi:cell division protein WhiA